MSSSHGAGSFATARRTVLFAQQTRRARACTAPDLPSRGKQGNTLAEPLEREPGLRDRLDERPPPARPRADLAQHGPPRSKRVAPAGPSASHRPRRLGAAAKAITSSTSSVPAQPARHLGNTPPTVRRPASERRVRPPSLTSPRGEERWHRSIKTRHEDRHVRVETTSAATIWPPRVEASGWRDKMIRRHRHRLAQSSESIHGPDRPLPLVADHPEPRAKRS